MSCRLAAQRVLLAALLALPLAGCGLGDLFGSGAPPAHYNLSATSPQGDEQTMAYLQTVMAARIATLPAAPEGEDERRRHQQYAAHMVQDDLTRALYARGYYAATISFTAGDDEYTGAYDIDFGPQYTVSSAQTVPVSFAHDLTIAAGDPLLAQTVLQNQAAIYKAAQKDNCYFTLGINNAVQLDHNNATAAVTINIDAGPQSTFGPTLYQGNERVRESYLRRLQPWKDGDCFRREQLESFKARLISSGLFARADYVLPAAPQSDGSVPVTMDLRTRAHRSLSAGMSYYTDTGIGVVLGWEHRNLLGAAEKLTVTLPLTQNTQGIDSEFTKPYFLRADQSLSLNASIKRDDSDAYTETGIKTGVRIKRSFGRNLSASTGLDLNVTRVDDKTINRTRTYGLVSLPQTVNYDNRNDALNPTRGVLLSATAEPFFDVLGEADMFMRTQLGAAGYWDMTDNGRFVLAGRAGLGNIWGTGQFSIPASKRFYAGGSSTVRGFGYQEVGPKIKGEPTGGRSLVNMSLELRSRFGKSFGAVAFVDAASVSTESTPDFDRLAVGAGVGFRYYTDFGPLRFDIATPLSEKSKTDKSYQIYISIGQAF